MKYRFHVNAKSERARHARRGYIAHIKHTLTSDSDADVVLCLVTRRHVKAGTTVEELDDIAYADSKKAEPLLRELAEKHGWLETPPHQD